MAAPRGRDVEEEFHFNREEVETLTEAVKDEKFRELLREYAEEITDPKNVAQYESEITQLEKERGVDVTFLHPSPCYVMKTSVNGAKKAFVNISTNENIGKPTCQRSTDEGKRGFQWAIPYSLAPAREDWDKERRSCLVYDVLFHPDTVYMAMKNGQFKKLVENTALEGIESNYKVQMDRKNVRYPRMKFKGLPVSTVIRKKSANPPSKVEKNDFVKYPPQAEFDVIHERDENLFDPKNCQQINRPNDDLKFTRPKYVLKYRNEIQMQDYAYQPTGQPHVVDNTPSELVVEVDLPLISSAASVELDVMEKKLKLESRVPAAYQLELQLPHSVDSDRTRAKFDSGKRKLTITLPVKKTTSNSLKNDDDENVNVGLIEPLDERTKNDNDDDDEVNNNEEKCDTRVYAPVKSEIFTTLPRYKVRQTNDKIILVFDAFNVDPESVETKIEDDKCVAEIRFTSLGSGFVPCYYSASIESPTGKKFVKKDEIVVDVGEANVVIHLDKDDESLDDWETVSIGSVGDSMESISLVTTSSLIDQLNEMQREINDQENNEVKNELDVTVTEMNENRLQFVVRKKERENSEDSKRENKENESASTDDGVNPSKTKSKPIPVRSKPRTMSETSDDMSPTHHPRSILKVRRSGRSLSESSEDAACWAQDESLSASPDGNIPEESSGGSADEENGTRKSVRFNEVVSRNLYRSNSSILGQRKKNQRKQKMKKRAAQRRTSESEGSETDNDTIKKKTNGVENKKDNKRKERRDTKEAKKDGGDDQRATSEDEKVKEKLVEELNDSPPFQNGDHAETNESKEEENKSDIKVEKADTALSWKEGESKNVNSDENVKLTNTAIYELD